VEERFGVQSSRENRPGSVRGDKLVLGLPGNPVRRW
jgi:hypothetical protein